MAESRADDGKTSTNRPTPEDSPPVRRRRHLREILIPLSLLHLDSADRKVIEIADVRDSIQKKTFTKWINKHLRKRHHEIVELFEDFRDGVKLLLLLEVLCKQILPRERGRLRFHRLQNIKAALDFLSYQSVRLVNIHPEEIADGNPKITLGLIWIIILKFQVTDVVLPGQHESTVRQSLLSWSQQSTTGYPIRINDFSRCWRDGKAFLYIIHKNRPDLVNMHQVANNTSSENLELAFDTAELQLGVTRLIDPEDMQVDQPDEKSVITYVASLYNVFPLPPSAQPVQDNELSVKTQEYENLAKPLIQWISSNTQKCVSKDYPPTLVEVKGVLSEFNKFRIEDIPAKLGVKRRLEILFHELENMIGQFPLEEQLHIDAITLAWDRLQSAMSDHEQNIQAEIQRLQRLQRLAEKVHRDTKQCEGYLDDVEQRLNEELARCESIHPLDAKNNCDTLQQILTKIDSHIQSGLTDVQNLRDGRYHQADAMYKRMLTVHQRLESLVHRLQTELLPKIRSVGTMSVRGSSSGISNANSPSYRLSSSSSGSAPLSAASTASPSGRLISPPRETYNTQRELFVPSTPQRAEMYQSQQEFRQSASSREMFNSTREFSISSSRRESQSSHRDFPDASNQHRDHSDSLSNRSDSSRRYFSEATNHIETIERSNPVVVYSSSEESSIPGRMSHSQSSYSHTSGAELLKQCIEWIELRRKSLDPSRLEFTSMGKLDKTVEQLRVDKAEIESFRQHIDRCYQSRSTLPRDEIPAFTQWLERVETAFNSISTISAQQLEQCETLQRFIRESNEEIKWLNDKQDEELTRNWNAATMGVDVMKEHFQVYLWKKKRLMDELQAHEKHFSEVQDKGEAIVRQKAIGSSMCESYLTAMQERWGYLLMITTCIDTHLKNTHSYFQFGEEIEECSTWLIDQTKVLNTEFSRSNITLEEGEALIKRMQEMKNTFSHYEQVISSLQERHSTIVPLRMRNQIHQHPVPVEALCSFSQDEFSMEKGEDCILLDNSDNQRWRVRNSKAQAGVVPSVCLTFPPPDPESRKRVQKLEEQYNAFIALWKEKQGKLKQDMIFATISVIKHWDLAKFKTLGAAQREAIHKAVNSDAQRILTEGNLPDSKRHKLKESLQKCNDQFIKLNRKLRDKESKEPRSPEAQAEEAMTNITYKLQEIDSELSLAVGSPIPRDVDTLHRFVLQHKERDAALENCSEELRALRRVTPGLGPHAHRMTNPLVDKLEALTQSTALYTQRLKQAEEVLQTYSHCSETVNTVEEILASLEAVTTDVDKLHEANGLIEDARNELSSAHSAMMSLAEKSKRLREDVEHERQNSDGDPHPDVERLDRDVAAVLNKWKSLTDDADTKGRNVAKSLEILTLSGHSRASANRKNSDAYVESKPRFVSQATHSTKVNGQPGPRAVTEDALTPKQMFASLQERGTALNRISKTSAGNSSAIKNKLEELYEELSKDLQTELEWSRGVEKALAAQGGLASAESELRQQHEEHQMLLEEVTSHQQLARTIIYQNEQLRDQELSLLSPDEVYEQNVLHTELRDRLDRLNSELSHRARLLGSCSDEMVKLNAEKVKLATWLQDAHHSLSEMYKRTNQLSRLRDVTDRYKTFHAEVVAHQADMRFLDLNVQKFVGEANSYQRQLMAFKASCQGTRSSLILEDEGYPIKEEVSELYESYRQLLQDCGQQVEKLNAVAETQSQFNESCDRLESWLQMAEKNLGALKREPIKTKHSDLQEQLDKVRDFTNAVMNQEKLIDDLRGKGELYSKALAATRVDGRHVEDIHETVNDLNCRHGMVAAEATARSNVLQTAMVQSQGLSASINGLLDWIHSAETQLNNMKPISLNLENLAEQIQEFKIFDSEVEAHKQSVTQVNTNATSVISSCTPDMAAQIEERLAELNRHSQSVLAGTRERARDVQDIYSDLQEFNERTSDLTKWLVEQIEVLETSDGESLTAQQLKDKIAGIQTHREMKARSLEHIMSLGRSLKENPRTGQVASVKESMANLDMTWNDFNVALRESLQIVAMKEEQHTYFTELRTQVVNWIESMERRVEALEPVAMDIQLIEQQIESLQPLMTEYEEQSPRLDSLNDIGNKCDTSPSAGPKLSPTRRSSSNLHQLSEIQKSLGETNHRYELIGDNLAERQLQLDSTLQSLKAYLIGVQNLMVYLNEVEPQVGEAYTPSSAQDAKSTLVQYREFHDTFVAKGSLLEQLRQKVYELTANRDDVPGVFDIETQLAQLEDRWKGVHQSSLSRCVALEGIESNLAHFTESAQFLRSWLSQKEKMLAALGPLATEPNMVKQQLHQVQVLEDELRSAQTKYDSSLEVGIQVLERSPPNSDQANETNSQLDNLAKHWNNLESQIKGRRTSLRAVLDNSGDLYDTLTYVGEWLASASDKVMALEDSDTETQLEARDIKILKGELEKNEKMVKYAQELSKKLMDTVRQPVAEADIKQKMMAVTRPFNELKKKLDALSTNNQSKLDKEKGVNADCDDMLEWLQHVGKQLQAPMTLSARDDVLKEQIRQHQSLENELADRRGRISKLNSQFSQLESISPTMPAEITAKMAAVQEEWQNVTKAADRRDKAIRAVSNQSDQFGSDLGRLLAWLEMTEGKLAKVNQLGDERAEVEANFKEAAAIQSEISRKKPELAVLLNNVQAFLASVDSDKDAVSGQVSGVESRWKALENLVDGTTKQLDDQSARLAEQQELLQQLTNQVKEGEEALSSRHALGPSALVDNKHLEYIKGTQASLRSLRPRLTGQQNGDSYDKPRLQVDSEELLSRFDALDANIDSWVGEMEEARVQVKEFQAGMKTMTSALSDLDDKLDTFDAISREASVIRSQKEQVKTIETDLAGREDTLAQLETKCRKLTHSGYVSEPQLYKAQIESMKKSIAKLQTKASHRHNNLLNKLDEVDNFELHVQHVNGEVAKAVRAVTTLKPVGTDVNTIKAQIEEYKDLNRTVVEPLQKELEQLKKSGHGLVRSAGPGIETAHIDAALDQMSSRWNQLGAQMSERDKKLDKALLQTGKYKDSVNSLFEWIEETESMIANQKPPSAEHKVAKAQAQEQKFLEKMIADRAENVEMVQNMAGQLNEQTTEAEKKQVNKEVGQLLARWQGLKVKVDDRSKALSDNLDVTKALHDNLEPFVLWLDKAEKKQSLLLPIAADPVTMQKQKDEQYRANMDIESKAGPLGAVLKRGQDVMRKSHGDDAVLVQDKLATVETRYEELERAGKARYEKIETAIPISEKFQVSCSRLLDWLDRVEPSIENTKLEHDSETAALEAQLSDIEPVFQTVVSEGAALTKLVPGEGAENISKVLNKTQKQFSSISDQIRHKVERQKVASEMKQEIESSVDELTDWFSEAESQLSTISPCSADPDELRQKLNTHKNLNGEMSAQRSRLKQLANTAKKLQREGILLDNPELNERLENVRMKAESLTRNSSEQLGKIEQVIPLAAQFRDLNTDIQAWLNDAEHEVKQAAITPDQIKNQQQSTKVIAQELADQKAFVDRLNKVGPSLARLVSPHEAATVQASLENVVDRYHSLKSAVRMQSENLKEKEQKSVKFADTVDGIITDLQSTKETIATAPPIAAKPGQLRDQIEANRTIVEDMGRKLVELDVVKLDADRLITEAGGVEDESVKALKDKIANLTAMYTDVKTATDKRNNDLKATLGASENFWTGLDEVKYQLDEVEGSLVSQEVPSLDPEDIREQQSELEALQSRLEEMEREVTDVHNRGEVLSGLVGDSEVPIVSSGVNSLNSEYKSVKEAWKQRHTALQAALDDTTTFQADLVKILNWLQGKEEKLASLGSVPGDTKSVKSQIESLKNYTEDVNDQYLQVEALNQKASDMVKGRHDTDAKVIRQPMSEVNKRWKSLLEGIGTRKTKLQNALLSLGQFQAAVAELGQWLERTEKILAEEDQPTVRGDPKIIEIELAKHKILLNDVQAHQAAIDQVNSAGQQVISSEGGAEAGNTRENLDQLNQRWEAVLGKTKNWQLSLEGALREAQEYQTSLNDMVQRLSEIDGQLSTSKPVGGLPETAKEQLEEFMLTYNELEAAQSKVAQLIQSGEDLLEEGNDASAQALQQNLDNLKSRWDMVTQRATEKKDRLEQALEQAETFHENQKSFINWLSATDKALESMPSPGCTLDAMQNQIAEHKTMQQEVTAKREEMLTLDKTSTHLRYFSQKSDATLIKNISISVQHKWEKIVARLAERTRLLDQALKEAKGFNDLCTDLCQWLDNSGQLLDSSQISSNDPDKIKSQIAKHKDFQRALGSKQPAYENAMKSGKDLLLKAGDEQDASTVGAMLTSLKAKWTNVCGKSIDRQRKLEESLLFSGQFKDALQALLSWLYKIEPFISDEQNVHGDIETVTKLAEQQKVFQQELLKRASNMTQVRDTAKDLIAKSDDSMPELQSQLIELTTSWDKVTKQAEKRNGRISEALKLADEFSRRANGFLEWVSESEQQLKYAAECQDDEGLLQQQLDEHKVFLDVIGKQRQYLGETLKLGEDILSKSHQEAVPVMKKWLLILRQRLEDVEGWSHDFETKLQSDLDTLRNSANVIEDLLGWLNSQESALVAMEEDPLPPEPSLIEDMLLEHQEFEHDISSRQSEVDRLTKPRKRRESGATTPTGRRSSSGTPSGRKSRNDLRKTSHTPEPQFKNPRVQALSVKWRHVWLMTMDRRRRLQNCLDQQREKQRLKNFNFEDWKKRYMNWMNHNKTRMMDFFRRLDRDRDGKVTRSEFIDGILSSKFPTSELECDAVAEIFDKNRDGCIDYKEFMNALRTDIEKEEKKSDAERIHDEVQKQASKCNCHKQYAIEKVSDNKYVFGESQKLRLVRILRSTVMVRVGGGWQALDEFLVKNDPCRAKGRTNTELREKFILSENVVGQGMSGFVSKPGSGRPVSRSGSTTPVGNHHHHHHVHSTTPVGFSPSYASRGVTPDREVSAIMGRKSRESPYGYSPANLAGSRCSSRASSRCSDISEDQDYPGREAETRSAGNKTVTTPTIKSRIPSLNNRGATSLKKSPSM